jgi:RNA polymerase-binding transcription factor DksA
MPEVRTFSLAVTTVTASGAAHRPIPTGRGPPADAHHVNLRQGEAHQLRPFLFFRLPSPGFPASFTRTGPDVSVDIGFTDQERQSQLRASLSEEFAVQTARLKELTEITADTGDPAQAHDRAALLAATRQSLEQITGALRRIAEGTYGRCERCGTAIPAERLEILPHAKFCVPCQQKQHR